MKKKLFVKQDGYKECGAACLLSIIRYYGGNISINKLVELTNTNKLGTNFYGLKKAASILGLESLGFRIDKEKDSSKFYDIRLPSICQIITNNYEHFVVVYKIRNNKIILMDPASGFKTMKFEEFIYLWTGYFMVFSKKKQLPFIKDNKYLNKIIIELLLKNKKIIFDVVILSIIFMICSCLFAMYSGIVIDKVINTTRNNLLIITFGFSILMLVKSISSFFRNELLIFLNQKLDCSLFLSSFKKILLLPYSYYKNRTTGEIITRINDLMYVKNMIAKIILTVFLDLIISIGCSFILFSINKFMFLILVITILVYFVIFWLFRKIIKKYIEINQENNAQINSLMIESINGFETIKNLNFENEMNEKMTSLYVSALNDSFTYDNITNIELFIKDMVSMVSILLIEFIGFNLVFNGILTVGEVVMFITIIGYFMEPIKNIIDLNKECFYALSSLKRANNLFDIESTDLVTETNYSILGNIKFNNLSYSYNEYYDVLKNINISINKGEKVLVLGNSGSGKSTILKLISKYYVPKRDSIYIDDVDINDISINNIKNNLVTVSQDEIIFTDTIKNNIVLNRDIDDVQFDDICKMTYVDDIVKDMFLGYETRLEENGQNISGGQRQRIVLARALLKDVNIILIDEGLNAIDINLERKILKNIFEKYVDKTIIIVSHRLENMDLYSKVIKLSNGGLDDVITFPGMICDA